MCISSSTASSRENNDYRNLLLFGTRWKRCVGWSCGLLANGPELRWQKGIRCWKKPQEYWPEVESPPYSRADDCEEGKSMVSRLVKPTMKSEDIATIA
jgi:hypothetical protein